MIFLRYTVLSGLFLFGLAVLSAEAETDEPPFPKVKFTQMDLQRFAQNLVEMKREFSRGSGYGNESKYDPERVVELWKAYVKRVEEVEPLNLEFAEEAAEILELKKEEVISGPGFALWREKMNPHGALRPGVIDPLARQAFLEDAERVLKQKDERLSNSDRSKVQKIWGKREKEVTKIIREFASDIAKHVRFSRSKARLYLLEKGN